MFLPWIIKISRNLCIDLLRRRAARPQTTGHSMDEMPGFSEDSDGGQVMCGFGRNAVMGVADKVIDAVKSGAIKHFFLVAGCDGAKPGRNYSKISWYINMGFYY